LLSDDNNKNNVRHIIHEINHDPLMIAQQKSAHLLIVNEQQTNYRDQYDIECSVF